MSVRIIRLSMKKKKIDSAPTYFAETCIHGGLSARPNGAAQTCACLSGRIPPASLPSSCCTAKLCLSLYIMQSSCRGSSRRCQASSCVEHHTHLDVLRRELGKMGSALAFRMEAEISAGMGLLWCGSAGGLSWFLRGRPLMKGLDLNQDVEAF